MLRDLYTVGGLVSEVGGVFDAYGDVEVRTYRIEGQVVDADPNGGSHTPRTMMEQE